MRKKPHVEPKEQNLSIVSNSCFLYLDPHVCVCVYFFFKIFFLRKLQYAAISSYMKIYKLSYKTLDMYKRFEGVKATQIF